LSDDGERFRKRKAKAKALVTSLLVGTGVMFVALSVEIVNLLQI
jgi:hypothetical protein